ncbi:FRG domain-containing protein [Bacillus cereus group sp. BfR-BA-01350]|uniref:FRG domain-containing protein n=1 Tax=Bacillus cereus group sp. BfR-BA-01350 TaxID=2920313 RepID=UPI001F58F0AD|nr:FRG domain-containing protein [Bacillus cereus group sp. BfR-BA-01350]
MNGNEVEKKEECLFGLLERVKEETLLLKASLEIPEKQSVVAFRGEPQDYKETKLLPSLYRKGLSPKQEIKLFDLLNDYQVIGEKEKTNLQKAIAAQHYLATSRLLDITFNVLVAIYFATAYENDKGDKDGYLYVFCLPQHFSPSSKYIEKYYNDMLLENQSELILKKNFKVVTHGHFNDRIKLQRGGFIFFPASNITRIPNCFYKRITINGEKKEKIRKQLAEFFSIYESTLFPEKDKLSDVITEGIEKTLEGCKIDNTLESELDSYFENIEFEINSFVKNNVHKKDVMRQLRKYEQDLFCAFNELEKKVKAKEEDMSRLNRIRQRACHDFEYLRISYIRRSY